MHKKSTKVDLYDSEMSSSIINNSNSNIHYKIYNYLSKNHLIESEFMTLSDTVIQQKFQALQAA